MGDSVEVERTSGTPSGWKAKMRGRDPYPYIIIAFLLVGIGGLVHFSLRSWGEPFDLKSSTMTHQLSMEQQHSDYVKGMNDLTYVISVCFNETRKKECERINISMPESLYRKLNNGQQP